MIVSNTRNASEPPRGWVSDADVSYSAPCGVESLIDVQTPGKATGENEIKIHVS